MIAAKKLIARLRKRPNLVACVDAAALIEQQAERIEALEAGLGDAVVRATFYETTDAEEAEADSAPDLRTAWHWGHSEGRHAISKMLEALLAPAPGDKP